VSTVARPTELWPPPLQETPLDLTGRYWAAEETMSPELRAELVLSRLRAQIEYAWRTSGFYQRHWSEHGVGPDTLRTLDDLAKFPLVLKDDIREDQESSPPFGSNLCCDPSEIARLHGTSGTTGRPVLFAISSRDWQAIGAAHARIMWGFGVRPTDTVFVGSLFSLYIGSWGALLGAERMGATVLPFGAGVPGQTERAIEYLQLVKPTVFYGTPSYALHIARTAESLGVDPRSFGFRVLFFSGEPGAGIPATKDRIERLFGGICVDTGSMAEMTPWMANAECDKRAGMHLWEDIVYTEIVDAETRVPLTGDGEGVPVYTHLWRTSQPMIRLFSGDLTEVTSEPCSCGRTYRRLPKGIYGRVDDMLLVRGVNVYPHVIEDVVGRVPGVGSEYRIVFARPAELETFSVEIEADTDDVAETVAQQVKIAVGLRPDVVVHPRGTLSTTEFKSRRIIDRRNGDESAGRD